MIYPDLHSNLLWMSVQCRACPILSDDLMVSSSQDHAMFTVSKCVKQVFLAANSWFGPSNVPSGASSWPTDVISAHILVRTIQYFVYAERSLQALVCQRKAFAGPVTAQHSCV